VKYNLQTSFPCLAMHPLEPSVTTAHWQYLARNSTALSGSAFCSPLNALCKVTEYVRN